MQREAKPRWKAKRFGEGADLYLRNRWLGGVGPAIDGECRYTTLSGHGIAPTQEEAKRRVEAAASQ